MSVVTTEEAQPQNIGGIIETLGSIREERRQIAARDKSLAEAWKVNELVLLTLLAEQGMDQAKTAEFTATIENTLLPNIDDWDALYEYIKEEDALYMLQRRISTAAFRELNDSGVEIPGVSAFVKQSIALRTR